MTVQEYKLYKETGVIPWYKAGIIKRFWKTNPTYEQVDIWSEMIHNWLIVSFAYFLLGLGLGLALFFKIGLI
jgi:hypothetical protein